MKALDRLQQRWEIQCEKYQDWLDHLNARERVLVIFTGIFVIVAVLVASLFYMHQAAEKQQKRAQQLQETLSWMQTNAMSMKAPDEMQLSKSEKIERAAQQQGVAVSSQQSGEQMRIQASHANYVALANFLKHLAQMGLSIEKLELIESEGQIKLDAAVL